MVNLQCSFLSLAESFGDEKYSKMCVIVMRETKQGILVKTLAIDPIRHSPRHLAQAVSAFQDNDIVIYPTAVGYSIGCLCHKKATLEKLFRLRHLSSDHPFSLICKDIAHISSVTQLSSMAFKCIKQHAPGPFTFVLPTGKRLLRQLALPKKRQTVGFRVSDHPVIRTLIALLDEPIASLSLKLPDTDERMCNPDEIQKIFAGDVACLIDVGYIADEATTVVDLTQGSPTIIRQGVGQLNF